MTLFELLVVNNWCVAKVQQRTSLGEAPVEPSLVALPPSSWSIRSWQVDRDTLPTRRGPGTVLL